MYCTVLHYTVLYCTVLHCTVLHCTVLYYTVLYYTVLCYTILYCIILYCITLCCIILYYTILYYTVLYYTVLYYTVLYYTLSNNVYHRNNDIFNYCIVLDSRDRKFYCTENHLTGCFILQRVTCCKLCRKRLLSNFFSFGDGEVSKHEL